MLNVGNLTGSQILMGLTLVYSLQMVSSDSSVLRTHLPLATLKKDIVGCLDIYLLLFYGACAEAVAHVFLCLLTRVPKIPEMLF